MKVALCLCGQTRTLQFTWPGIVEHLIKPFNSDVFIHTWDTNNGGIGSAERFPLSQSQGVKDKIQFFKNNKPSSWTGKMRLCEEPFDEQGPWNFIHGIRQRVARACLNMGHMYYGIYRSIELKRQEEETSGTVYDMVIRSRMDSFYINDLIESEITEVLNTPDLVYVAKDGFNIDMPSRDDHISEGDMKSPWVPDQFSFCSSKTMDVYGDTYNNILDLSKQYASPSNGHPDLSGPILGPEVTLGTQLKVNNITVKRSAYRYKSTAEWSPTRVVGRSYYDERVGDPGDIIINVA